MTLNTSSTLSFRRVLQVEYRKVVSTRPLRILLASVVVLVLGITAAFTYWHGDMFSPEVAESPEWLPWFVVAFILRLPIQYVLPAIIVLIVTTEWSTRSAMTTFTLVPRRSWVIAAKSIVALTLIAISYALICAGGIFATWFGRERAGVSHAGMWGTTGDVLRDVTGWLLLMLCALGIALLLDSSSLAIAVALVAPTIVQILRTLNQTLSDIFAWVDLNGMIQAVLLGNNTENVPQLVVAALLWVVAPLVAGMWITLTREVA